MNKLLVYGCIGPNRRCWLALVSVVKDVPQIKIIHEARQPYRPVTNPKDPSVPLVNDDPTMGFQLMWWYVVTISDRRICFVGRQAAPLAIDLESGQVEVVRFEPGAANAWGTVLARDSFLYKAYTTGVAQYEMPDETMQLRLQRKVVDSWLPGTAPLWADYPPRLMEHEGWIYKTGKVWYRFRPDGSSVQRLTSPESPRYFLYEFAGPSNHFGIVGWSPQGPPRELYKITLPK